MKVYLLDHNSYMIEAWRKYFSDEDVEIVEDEFEHFMKTVHVDCVVSPANGFGLMDGGYDLAITEWFGEELQKTVQQYIQEELFGEQPVGSSIIVDTPIKGIRLIHTPTMRVPEKIIDPSVVYHCMRSTLIIAKKYNVESIVIPAFGGRCGRMIPENVALMMFLAWKQIQQPPKEITWEYAAETHFR